MIAVTGITGHSGSFFVQQLVDNGFEDTVRCLVRESSNTDTLDASGLKIEKVYGSLDSVEDMMKLVEGADTVLHLAGIWKTPVILEAVERCGNRPHVICVHTSAIYSKHKMASEVYKDIERRVQPYIERGMNVTILRPTMIFGDLKDHNISKFIKMVDRFPIMPEIDHGAGRIQPVNARDLGQAYYKAMLHPTLPQRDYFVSGQRELPLHELFDLTGEYLGKRTKHLSVPMSVGVAGAKFINLLSGGKRTLLIEKVLRLGEDRCFSHEDAARDFGYEPEEFNVGLKREVEEYIAKKRS